MGRSALLACIALGLATSHTVAADPMEEAQLVLTNGRPVVEGVYVNGHGPYRFLIDTGSTFNHLDPTVAESLGLVPTLHTTLLSSTGSAEVAGCDGADIQLGGTHAGAQVVLLAGMEAIHRIGRNIQGVLGEMFLARFDYELNFKTGRLTFGAREPDLTVARTSFTVVAGRPLLSTSLGPLVLDSGAPQLIRFGIAADRDTGTLVTATGLTNVGTVSSTLAIGGHTVWRGNALAVRQAAESGAGGLLPLGPFGRVYVSNSEKYVVLEPH